MNVVICVCRLLSRGILDFELDRVSHCALSSLPPTLALVPVAFLPATDVFAVLSSIMRCSIENPILHRTVLAASVTPIAPSFRFPARACPIAASNMPPDHSPILAAMPTSSPTLAAPETSPPTYLSFSAASQHQIHNTRFQGLEITHRRAFTRFGPSHKGLQKSSFIHLLPALAIRSRRRAHHRAYGLPCPCHRLSPTPPMELAGLKSSTASAPPSIFKLRMTPVVRSQVPVLA